jgi:hypothetical protein
MRFGLRRREFLAGLGGAAAWPLAAGASDIMWWLGDWTRLILHQLPLPRLTLERSKDRLSLVYPR